MSMEPGQAGIRYERPEASEDTADPVTARPATAEPPTAEPAPAAEPGQAGAEGRRPGLADDAAEAGLDAADGPLLGDAAGLRASWHRIQAGFVDDPREAVSDAANLVEHTAQALVGALRQRQRLLRGMWDDMSTQDASDPDGIAGSAGAGRPAAGDGPDTEHLRLVLRRYRVLFDEIAGSAS